AILLAPIHRFTSAVMTIATDGDVGVWPMQPDAPHQPTQMGTHLLAVRRLPGAQDCQYAMTGAGIIDMDRQEALLIVMRIEQRQLLMAMDGVCGIVDIERDRLGRSPETLAPQVHHCPRHSYQGAQVRGVLPT